MNREGPIAAGRRFARPDSGRAFTLIGVPGVIPDGFDANWHLSEAVDIHDAGWILGNGTKGGDARGWLLVRQATQ